MNLQTGRSGTTPLIDVAIIGGGVSGAYSAYRLLKTDPQSSPILEHLLHLSGKDQLTVELFEASDRIGGRLWSYRFPDMPNLVAELGGMCFDRLQQNVYGLCTQALKLELTSCGCYGVSNLQYLRGKRFYAQQLVTNPEILPFHLSEKEKGQPEFILIKNMLEESVPGSAPFIKAIEAHLRQDNLPEATKEINALQSFLREATLTDRLSSSKRPLYECGFWNLLAEAFSNEAYQLTTLSGPLLSDYRSCNAYDAFLLFLNLHFATLLPKAGAQLVKGYDQLPKMLIERFIELGGRIHLKKRLHNLQIKQIEEEQLIALTFSSPQEATPATVYARHVILTLPQRALKLLDSDSAIFKDPQFRADLHAVTPVPSSKLFLTYNIPWWENIPHGPNQLLPRPITKGHSITDLPVRACYYFGAEKDGRALLLASFTDDVFTHFWNGYRPTSCFGAEQKPYLSGRDDGTELGLLAPPEMVGEAQRQLKILHGYDDIPAPLAAIYIDWTQDPYGGGWHVWNPHLQSWEVIARIRQPVPGVNIFLCGDSYSAQQGWVEGALNTAEMVLETYLGLPRPDWVLPEYDFGP